MDVAAVVASGLSVSDKIRALDKAGHSRADIARLLGRRYQQVRNVLEGDKLATARAAQGVEERGRPFSGVQKLGPLKVEDVTVGDEGPSVYRLEISADGEVRLPEEVMQAFRLHRGGTVVAEARDGVLALIGAQEHRRRTQAFAAKYATPGRSIVDEFLAERRGLWDV